MVYSNHQDGPVLLPLLVIGLVKVAVDLSLAYGALVHLLVILWAQS